jgi:hypothetical protein
MEAKHIFMDDEPPDLKNTQHASRGRLFLRSVRVVGLWDRLPTVPFRFPATPSQVVW